MTTKPVPSTDPADLAINAGLFDTFMHGTAATFTDRLGASKWTMAGAAALFPDAVTYAGAAEVSADAAEVSRLAAEAARDAAVIQPGLYASEALGRAAVANGEAFKVQGSGDIAAYEYRRTDASTSVLLASYPAISAYTAAQAATAAVAARATDLEQASAFVAGALPEFRYIRRLELFGANPAKFYSVRYFLRNDSGVRFSFTVSMADDAVGAGATDVAQFISTGVSYTGRQSFTLAQIAASGVTGVVVVDFDGAAASWGLIRGSGGVTFANTAIRPDCLQTSTALDAYIGAVTAATASVASLTTRITDVESATDFQAGASAHFRCVKKLRLFGADNGKHYSVRYFFRNDSGTRFTFTVSQASDSAGTDAADVCSFTTTGVNYSGLVEFTLAELSASGITGTLVVDFDLAAPSFSVIRGIGGQTFASMRIRQDALASSAASDSAVAASITEAFATSSTLTAGQRLPFADQMDTSALRRMVKDLWLYGCDPTHDYIVSGFAIEQFPGSDLTRLLITITDLTTALDVARYSLNTVYTADLVAWLAAAPEQVKLTDAAIANKSNIWGVMTLDFSAQATTYIGVYATMATGGIHKARTLSDEQVADYLDRDYWHEVIPVGAGQTYTTLRAAVESLYADPVGKTCHRSHYHHRVLIDLIDDGTYNATYLTIPEFVEVRGNGVDRTFILKENNDPDAMLEAHWDTKFLDCTIHSESTTGEYCIHSDDVNRKSRPGSKQQNRRLRQSFKRLKLTGGPDHAGCLFGSGISSGQVMRFEDVEASHEKFDTTLGAFFFHNTGATLAFPTGISGTFKPPRVEMSGCRSPDQSYYGVYLQTLEPTALCTLVLDNSSFNLITHQIAGSLEVITDRAADRVAWRVSGVHSGAIMFADADGAWVLGTTAGLAVTGTAAALIFGTVDELGRGDLWIKTGTVKSLGARLGDCSVVPKTLTINGQTCTFSTDLTAVANSTIIAAINAAIPSAPVAEVDIKLEHYPDTGYHRRALNSTGATIGKGKFVKRTGRNTIALAGSGDGIYGWVFRDILDGLAGDVVTTKSIHAQYISGAGADGQFGITAGVLDYGASPKVGEVAGSIVTLY